MLRLNRTFKVVLPLLLVTTVPTAYPQSAPAKVKVGDVEYSVTPMSRGRMLRIDDLAGHLIGMASVNGANVSVLAPQQEPGFSVVRNAATEYLHPTNGGATAAANTPPPPPATVDDPNAAQREAQLARLANVTGSLGNPAAANPLGPAKLTVEFPAAGGAIVKGTSFGDITYSADGTEARAVQKTSSPITGDTTIELIARYQGGEDPGKGKTSAVVKGGLKTLIESANPRARGNINTRGNDEIVVSQSTNGGKPAEIIATGEKHVSQSEYAARDPNSPYNQRGKGFLKAVYEGLQAAMVEATKRRAAGEAVPFDPASTVAGQNALKEYARYEAK